MNKRIVITGATKGIGRAVAVKFAAGGFDLALCARSENELQQLKQELSNGQSNIIAAVCDVSKKEQVKSFGEKVLRELGGVDVLVNNAGLFIPGQVISEKEGALEQIIDTNLYSAYHLTRTLLPKMIERKQGHIFNMCSVASIKAYPNGGAYTISKYALLGFSKSLREELKEYHIAVTSVLPGATLTDSWKGTDLPESRFMKPEDVASAIWDIYNLSANTVVEEILLRPVLGDI